MEADLFGMNRENRADSGSPEDQLVRGRFIGEVDRNFSVVAPAGVGKTAAIVERVAAFALSPQTRPEEVLKKLFVVTYTNRAADEMQQRARQRILAAGGTAALMPHFNRAFFGTIHSLCLRLLQTYGHHLGLPARLEAVTDTEDLWLEYLRGIADPVGALSPELGERLLRHVSLGTLLDLARAVPPRDRPPAMPGREPAFAAEEILDCPPNPRSRGKVEGGQAVLRAWLARRESSEAFAPLPDYAYGGAIFQERWKAAFQPLREWLAHLALVAAHRLAMEFQRFRLERGVVTFDDQTILAARLLRDEVAGPRLRAEGFRIILDEAQDTDPLQFELLLELARPVSARGTWPETAREDPPRPGHFCMVGDPQQSIYGERADVRHYLAVQSALESEGAAECLTFTTTFRCDRAVVNWVNACGPRLLHGEDRQVEFVALRPRPAVAPGQVVRLAVTSKPHWSRKTPIRVRSREEARQLVTWIREHGLSAFRADSWSDVAILCPRKRWFGPLALELQRAGMRFQIQSTRDIYGDSVAYTWLAALLKVMAEPENGFEVVGVLREIYGISDQELADFSGGDGQRFRLDLPGEEKPGVAAVLQELRGLRMRLLGLPMRDAVAALIGHTGLRARIKSLPPEFRHGEDEVLAALEVAAAAAEAEFSDLYSWSRRLEDGFAAARPEEVVREDSIQLITCQKAKGLQWRAVIIPFFFREIRDAPSGYPIYYPSGPLGAEAAVLDKNGMPESMAEAGRLRRDQEFQRLLYVAMTRARHTLVLVDDEAFFPEERRCFGRLLEVDSDGRNREEWHALTGSLRGGGRGDADQAALPDASAFELPPITPESIAAARKQAGDFPRRQLPHAMAHPGDDEGRESRAQLESGWEFPARQRAILYGIWWHGLCESMPWNRPPDEWESVFDNLLGDCPDPDRGRIEWNRFRRSKLAGLLVKPGLIFHTEIPFLWNEKREVWWEGVIDLAAYDPESSTWRVVDWKTDRLAERDIAALAQRYEPQVAAYRAALYALRGAPVEAGIYATVPGVWHPFHHGGGLNRGPGS